MVLGVIATCCGDGPIFVGRTRSAWRGSSIAGGFANVAAGAGCVVPAERAD
jgi:hypothetical protein